MTTIKKAPEKIKTKLKRTAVVGSEPPLKTEEIIPQQKASGSLIDFFYEELKEMYWTEQHLLQVLPILNHSAHSEALKIALGEHQFQTEMHVSRLQDIFKLLDRSAEAKRCRGIEGITKEVLETVEEIGMICALSDVAIIMGSQKAEHYEISGYGSLKHLALTLERNDIADILGLTLAEEKAADELLTVLATRNTNIEAQVKS